MGGGSAGAAAGAEVADNWISAQIEQSTPADPSDFWIGQNALGIATPDSCAPIAAEPSPPRQHEVGRRGSPMDDVLHAVDLDRRPVVCMAVILPPEMRHSRPASFRVVQRARWMTSKQGQRILAEVGGTLSPAAAAMYGLVEVRCRIGTSARPSMASSRLAQSHSRPSTAAGENAPSQDIPRASYGLAPQMVNENSTLGDHRCTPEGGWGTLREGSRANIWSALSLLRAIRSAAILPAGSR